MIHMHWRAIYVVYVEESTAIIFDNSKVSVSIFLVEVTTVPDIVDSSSVARVEVQDRMIPSPTLSVETILL